MSSSSDLQDLARCIRGLSMDAVQKANSGHPGMPMGCAELGAVLFSNHLRFDPSDPRWAGRDRFVLSAGHGSMLLYSLLHLFGYELPLSELENFRQWESKTPGHPEFEFTPGVETTTGPLGQGFANGVGMALGAKALAARYDQELFEHCVYAIVSDGDLMEGVASEAASLAGQLQLGNLIYLYDDNDISIGGSTDICFVEDVPARFKAYGWDVTEIDGHDIEQIDSALSAARNQTDKPSLIVARTTIGKGSPNKAGTAGSHGAPLGEDEVQLSKKELGLDPSKSFFISDSVKKFCSSCVERNKEQRKDWEGKFSSWAEKNPEKAVTLKSQMQREIPADILEKLEAELSGIEKEATRGVSGKAIQVLAAELPFLIGGSADLEPSNKTLIKTDGDLGPKDFLSRNIRFGVREHAMGAIVNGLAYERSWLPYCATFLVFSDYMRPTIRLAALSHLQSLFIYTHDSFWVGEDGPTHQPIEHLDALRLIPNNYVFRPADGPEVAGAYAAALNLRTAPSCLLFSRQGLERLESKSDDRAKQSLKGAYVLEGDEDRSRVVVASGSETRTAQLALANYREATGNTARLVSMPCLELFLEQDQSYIDSVIPTDANVVVVEAGSCVVPKAKLPGKVMSLGIERFGASAPGGELAERFGFSADSLTERFKELL